MEENKRKSDRHNLYAKTECEAFKDTIIGNSLDLLLVTKLPLKCLILQRTRVLYEQSSLNRGALDISDKEIAHTTVMKWRAFGREL